MIFHHASLWIGFKYYAIFAIKSVIRKQSCLKGYGLKYVTYYNITQCSLQHKYSASENPFSSLFTDDASCIHRMCQKQTLSCKLKSKVQRIHALIFSYT